MLNYSLKHLKYYTECNSDLLGLRADFTASFLLVVATFSQQEGSLNVEGGGCIPTRRQPETWVFLCWVIIWIGFSEPLAVSVLATCVVGGD